MLNWQTGEKPEVRMSINENSANELVQEPILRGDPMNGERYFSREFMVQEWDRMWTRVWHIGGVEAQRTRRCHHS